MIKNAAFGINKLQYSMRLETPTARFTLTEFSVGNLTQIELVFWFGFTTDTGVDRKWQKKFFLNFG